MASNWFKGKQKADGETDAPLPEDNARGGGWMDRLRSGLSKTRRVLTTDIEDLFGGGGLDEDLLEDLEERLVTADMGVPLAMELVEGLRKRAGEIRGPGELREAIRQELLTRMRSAAPPPDAAFDPPRVVLVVGVNGVGKTTTIGKLAARATRTGQRVLLAAGDTFRAAAVEQLEIWARRARADIVRHRPGADPAAVAFDSVAAARARGMDLVLVDTAGRLHTQVNLMEELKKVKRAITKQYPQAPHEVLLILDATTGQNALNQARQFHEALNVTGVALTKLDGTARGGIAVSLCTRLGLPLQYVGVGEGLEDLQPFDAVQFVRALV